LEFFSFSQKLDTFNLSNKKERQQVKITYFYNILPLLVILSGSEESTKAFVKTKETYPPTDTK